MGTSCNKMGDLEHDSEPLSSSKLWGLLPKYIQVPPDEERILKRKQRSWEYLKYGVIIFGVVLIGFWLTWLTLETGDAEKELTIGNDTTNIDLLMETLRQASGDEERERRNINRRRRDCTAKFKNRRASLEYRWWPANWLTPTSTIAGAGLFSRVYRGTISKDNNVNRVKLDNSLGWMFHDCGTGVCIETMKEDWENYFLEPVINYEDRILTRSAQLKLHTIMDQTVTRWKIWCDTCGGVATSLYSNCELRTTTRNYPRAGDYTGVMEEMKLYLDGQEYTDICKSCGPDTWFRWRIEAAPTRKIWEPHFTQCNCGHATMKMAPKIRKVGAVTLTSQTSHSRSVKMEVGMEAIKILKTSGVTSSGEDSYTWTETEANLNSDEVWIESEKVPIRPGYKLVMKQLVGEANYAKIASRHQEVHIEPCTCHRG